MSKRARLLGSVLLLGVLAWRLEWGRLGPAFAGLRLELWALAVLVYVLAQAASSLRWQLLAGALGFGGPWGRYFAHYFLGMFFNLVLPTSVGGDVVRAWYLSRAEGRRAAAFVSVLADRATGLVVLIALACTAALCAPMSLAPWLAWAVTGLGAATVLGVLALPLLPCAAARAPLGRAKLQRLVEVGRACFARPGVLLAAGALGVVVQLANVVFVWLIGVGMGLEVPLAYYGVLVPLVALLTLLPVSVNGMGLREAGTVVLLAPLGVPAEQAVFLALLQFAAIGSASLLGGLFYLGEGWPRPRSEGSEEDRGDAEPVRGGADQGRARQPSAAA